MKIIIPGSLKKVGCQYFLTKSSSHINTWMNVLQGCKGRGMKIQTVQMGPGMVSQSQVMIIERR